MSPWGQVRTIGTAILSVRTWGYSRRKSNKADVLCGSLAFLVLSAPIESRPGRLRFHHRPGLCRVLTGGHLSRSRNQTLLAALGLAVVCCRASHQNQAGYDKRRRRSLAGLPYQAARDRVRRQNSASASSWSRMIPTGKPVFSSQRLVRKTGSMPSRSTRWRASSVTVWVSAMKRASSSVRLGLVYKSMK